jgi:hypothetical protein
VKAEVFARLGDEARATAARQQVREQLEVLRRELPDRERALFAKRPMIVTLDRLVS